MLDSRTRQTKNACSILLSTKRKLTVIDFRGSCTSLLADHQVEYFFFAVSFLRKLQQGAWASFCGNGSYLGLLRSLIPYVVIMASFVAFVVLNGGVVLGKSAITLVPGYVLTHVGDKSNHVATLHLAQVLYVWPYITFFSIPLTYPYLLQGTTALLAAIPIVAALEYNMIFKRKQVPPRPLVAVLGLVVTALVVRYSTFVHPFTLADNRHYTFYVFRILLRHPSIRYLVTPVYVITAWSVTQALGGHTEIKLSHGSHHKGQPAHLSASKRDDPTGKTKSPPTQPLKLNHASSGEGSTISFVVVWFATTLLQLATAPLVEPRYVIVPWIMWRLRVPQAAPPELLKRETLKMDAQARLSIYGRLKQVFRYHKDHRLWLETAWFLAINAFTGYMFLYRGFEWPQEPGKVQRFMW